MKCLLFNALHYCVSLATTRHMLKELKRAQSYVGTNKATCGCCMKSTHGLPCAHELGQWNILNMAVRLNTIHPH
ncbi:hypothetical protein L6164_013301 [Bauhinia variegata]|uniref:Uncharacterized protein n=1 Tax=Bauhinia variegata TaxID=167791 RepID=A0ACB9PDT6_BAUVA|nr:hypothetical protein L6164_013301 [Bauhinia variegata]